MGLVASTLVNTWLPPPPPAKAPPPPPPSSCANTGAAARKATTASAALGFHKIVHTVRTGVSSSVAAGFVRALEPYCLLHIELNAELVRTDADIPGDDLSGGRRTIDGGLDGLALNEL